MENLQAESSLQINEATDSDAKKLRAMLAGEEDDGQQPLIVNRDVLDLLTSVSDIPTPKTYSNVIEDNDDKAGSEGSSRLRNSIGFITNESRDNREMIMNHNS